MVDEASILEVRIARYLLMSILVSMFVSTSATVGLEITCYALFAFSPSLRKRFVRTFDLPAGIGLGLFALTIVAGVSYGLAPWSERLGALIGWRKFLLFFMAAAVFEEEGSRKAFLLTLLWLCFIAVCLSYLTFFFPIVERFGNGIALKDHAIQGLVFAVGAAAAVWSGYSFWNLSLAALLVLNVAFVTPGRVGYLALVVLAVALGVQRSGKWGAIIIIGCIAALALSSQVRDRIAVGINELQHVDDSPSLTSMGWRLVMLWNTLEIIEEHPILGVGTGSFETAYHKKVKGRTGWRAESTNDPHNQYLKVRAEQGLPGVIAFIVFIGFAAITKSPFRELHVGVLGAWCVASLFASYFSRFVEGRFIFLWLGVMLASSGMPPAQVKELRSSTV